jgi:benzoyl-CoA-dihydrodiol lyase
MASDFDAGTQLDFETHPSRYRHVRLSVEGPVARLTLAVQPDGGLRDDYQLKLNSYDMTVDIELADAVQRLRFEHPEVGCVIVTSALEGCFCAGANIFMLGGATHGHKVNFCKFTNETRLYIEDATEHSGQVYVAACNGIASGGGYELPLACREIYLVDDRRSAVSLPEVPYLGVLPGTGGLPRVVDTRRVRRDRADLFATLAEGVRGERAVQWGLVDAVWPPSKFDEKVLARAREIAGQGRPERRGVTLEPLQPEVGPKGVLYRHVELRPSELAERTMELVVHGPDQAEELPAEPSELGSGWYPLRMLRELDDALLRLRFHYPEVGLVVVRTRGDLEAALALDKQLVARRDHWLVAEVLLLMKRVLKRLDMTSKSFFALVDAESCFAGSLFELALASDRSYILDAEGVQVALSPLNAGPLPMGNGLARLETRFLGTAEPALESARESRRFDAEAAVEAGLVTDAYDELDWEDEMRLVVEERASLSPDALTGMEANLRFAGPETLETKIFGRLSAWQNWIFQRPNAVGERGALTLYGQPESPQFDWRRT